MKAHAKTPRRKESATVPSALCALALWREPNAGAKKPANAAPTFTLLREKRRLAVCNPDNGARFTISLHDWEDIVWFVRVYPEPQWRDPGNPYTTAHRIMARTQIENWLEDLQLA